MILWALFFNFVLLQVFYMPEKNILCSPDKTRSFGVWCNFRQLRILVLTKILSYNFMILSSANFYMLTRLNCPDKKKYYVLDFRCFRCFRFYFCNIDYILNETNNEALQVKHVFGLIAVVTLRTYYYYYYFSFIFTFSTS